jgi:dipeptidyl aminopeptidase/acylaminoacyl peptidase
VVLLLWCGALSAEPSGNRRPFEVNDLFELEDLGQFYGGPYAYSADGRRLAYTRIRPKKTLANFTWEFLWGNAGADVWVQLRSGDAPVNITRGVDDGSGWWAPEWSPDGLSLAMLSTRGGNVYVWIWDSTTRRLRQLSHRGVDLVDIQQRPYLWLDSHRLIVSLLDGPDKANGIKEALLTPMTATREWSKTPLGREATVSAIESGVAVDAITMARTKLVVIDTETANERVIADGNTRGWALSGDQLAFAQQIHVTLPSENEPLPAYGSGFYRLRVVRLDDKSVPVSLALENIGVLESSLRWSPDRKEISFVGRPAKNHSSVEIYRYGVLTQKLRRMQVAGLCIHSENGQSAALEWTADKQLLLQAFECSSPQRDLTSLHWWLVQKDGRHVCLTRELREPFQELWPNKERSVFFGAADGALWRLSPDSKATNRLVRTADDVSRILWPQRGSATTQSFPPGMSFSSLIFETKHQAEEGHSNTYVLDLKDGSIAPIHKPIESAEVVAFSASTGELTFSANSRNGLTLWRASVLSNTHEVLFRANEFLHDIAEGQFKAIEYTSLRGQRLTAWLLLPPGYDPLKKYPLIVSVYPGLMYDEHAPEWDRINRNFSLNLQIAAAKGFVVLFPSMPLASPGVKDDPLLRAPEGVLPAIDKAIDLGIADSQQLFLLGASFGGFATYALVTQTDRFKAAVVLAGLSNLVSLYGQFDARVRYSVRPQSSLTQPPLMELSQGRMASPPWKDPERYVRNSPIFSADRVHTPLMIIQGDLDYVPIQQGEEFFTALYRQGKRAEFVRYWGEGHVMQSPANIRDMWTRIFAWFDQGDATRPP